MTDTLREAIRKVEQIHRDFAADRPTRDGLDHLAWRKLYNEANSRAFARLEDLGAVIKNEWNGSSLRLAGVRSTSTSGLYGAVSNWLTLARSKVVV